MVKFWRNRWRLFLVAGIAATSPATWSNSLLAGSNDPSVQRYFAQIGVGQAGSIGFNTDFVFINSGDPTEFVLDFFESNGEPLPVDIFRNERKIDTTASLQTRLARGETLNLAIRREGRLRAGYARLTSSAAVSGVIAFTRNDLSRGRRIQYQAGVPLAPVLRDFSVPVKFVPAVGDMAFAIVNPTDASPTTSGGDGSAHVVFRLYDEAFGFHGAVERTLPAGAHLARFIAELFPQIEELAQGIGFNGSMTVESDRPLAAISVLHTNVPTLTTVPVTPGRADEGAAGAILTASRQRNGGKAVEATPPGGR